MKKALLVSLVLIIGGVFAFATLATGGSCPPPPPPPCDGDAGCSPGFWKNHTEIWEAYAGDDFAEMLAALESKGNNPERLAVANELNTAFPNAPCDDD